GARAGRSEEEDDEDEGDERPGREAAVDQEDAEGDGDRSREQVGRADHRFASDRVEKPPEGQRPEEVRERKQRNVERNRPGTDYEEFPKQGSEVEGDGVVEERLADEQGEPENRALRVFRERGGGDLAEVDPFARANRDRLLGLLELLPGALPH